MVKSNIGGFIVALILIGGGSFYGGMEYQQSKSSLGNFRNMTAEQRQQLGGQFRNAQSGQAGQMVRRTGFGAGGEFINGEILKKDVDSVTIKLADGGSKIVFFSTSTQIGKMEAGNAVDLSVGASVSVSGKSNDDGSLSAQSIQIRSEIIR